MLFWLYMKESEKYYKDMKEALREQKKCASDPSLAPCAKSWRDAFNSAKEAYENALKREELEEAKSNYGIDKIVIEFVYPTDEDLLRVRSIDEAIDREVSEANGKNISA